MSFSLLPYVQTKKLTDITEAYLNENGIRLLMMDFDNTIVPYTSNVPTQEVVSWLSEMQKSNVQLCVVSNSKNQRVQIFCKEYHLDCITHARKPFPDGICRCLDKYGISPEESALVGDQIFTDTLGANCAGVKAILIEAIDNHNIWLKLRHVAELPFIYLGRNRRMKK